MKNQMKRILLSAFICLFAGTAMAQNPKVAETVSTDSVLHLAQQNEKEISALKTFLEKSWIKNFKVSGYIQFQWQMAQEKGQNAQYNGGNFAENSDNRFMVRRGRLKLAYDSPYFAAALQMDASNSGVSLVEAAIDLRLPSQVAALSTGLIYMPFTYYIDYSSSARMNPEIPRIVRALSPNDTGLGVMGVFSGKKGTELNNLKLNVGVFSQNGFKADINPRKTLQARVQYNKSFGNIGFGLMGSMLRGGIINIGTESYTYDKAFAGYVRNEEVQGTYNTSLYYDLGGKLNFTTAAGKTDLTGEYLWGIQPGFANSNATPKDESGISSAGAVYNRKFNGYYVNLAHEFPKIRLSLLARFDKYDPNRQVSGNNIGLYPGTGAADLSYSTLGLGLCYAFLKDHLRLVAYYEFVWNEKSINLSGYDKHIKDNLFTLRLQAKF